MLNRVGATLFGLLVVATFAAFFITQRLKRSPLVVRQRTLTTYLRADRRSRRASIRIELGHPDLVTARRVTAG